MDNSLSLEVAQTKTCDFSRREEDLEDPGESWDEKELLALLPLAGSFDWLSVKIVHQ